MSLKTKVTSIIAATVVAVSLVSTLFFTATLKKSIEREIIARGLTMAESLSRAVDEGLAAENLDFIRKVEDIVHTKDVNLAQVYTELWYPVEAYPHEQFEQPPAPAAREHFKKDISPFFIREEFNFDFYSPVFYHQIIESSVLDQTADKGKFLIGFVRLRLSTDQMKTMIRSAVITNAFVAACVSLFAVVLINLFMRRYVLKPVLTLHTAVSRHREGELPDLVPIQSADEIGELSAEFNLMSQAVREREERLAEEKERLAVTLRSIGDGVIVTDIDGAITLLNRIAEVHTGWTAREAVGHPLTDVFRIVNEKTREACESPVERVMQTGVIVGLANHTVLIRKDLSEIIIEDSAAPIPDRDGRIIGVVVVFRDATEKRRMEEEMLKVEKLESVGLLAGGLAHDFNNLLTSIVGNISMAKMYLDANSKAFARLTEAETASRRATDLTYQLLTFSKGGAPVRRTASIVDIVRESASFTLAGTNVAPEFHIAENIGNVNVDAGQMSQVFNNLIINAVQAMPSGGKITFTIANRALAKDEAPPLPEGDYVTVLVRDTGGGIPPNHLSKIFDPYFTTKQKGSGLGLTSVYSVIKRHDGHITVDSAPGQGTTFSIYLPASSGQSAFPVSESASIIGGDGKILIMDDEKFLRDISGEMLRSLGYEVSFAQNGEEAVALYRAALEAGSPFAAVIMDLTIPGGMGGKEAIQHLRNLDPQVRAIVSSGYSNDPVMAEYEKYGFRGVVTKPYSIVTLSKALREALEP